MTRSRYVLNLGQRVEQPRKRWKPPRRSLRSQGLSPLRFRRLQPAVTEVCACAHGRRGGARAASARPRRLRVSASAASVSARTTAARGAAGSRKIWKMEAAEPAAGGRGRGSAEGQGGGETALAHWPPRGCWVQCGALGRRTPGRRVLRQRLGRHPRIVVGNEGHAWYSGWTLPRPAPSRAHRLVPPPRGRPQPKHPPGVLAAPRGPCAAASVLAEWPRLCRPPTAERSSVRWRPLCGAALTA